MALPETTHQYLDICVYNNSITNDTSPKRLQFYDKRTQDYIQNPADYYVSLVRFSIGSQLPIIIPQMKLGATQYLDALNTVLNPEWLDTIYSITLTETISGIVYESDQTFIKLDPPQNAYLTPIGLGSNPFNTILPIQSMNDVYENPYYYIDSVEWWVVLVNYAIERANISLTANIANLHPPIFPPTIFTYQLAPPQTTPTAFFNFDVSQTASALVGYEPTQIGTGFTIQTPTLTQINDASFTTLTWDNPRVGSGTVLRALPANDSLANSSLYFGQNGGAAPSITCSGAVVGNYTTAGTDYSGSVPILSLSGLGAATTLTSILPTGFTPYKFSNGQQAVSFSVLLSLIPNGTGFTAAPDGSGFTNVILTLSGIDPSVPYFSNLFGLWTYTLTSSTQPTYTGTCQSFSPVNNILYTVGLPTSFLDIQASYTLKLENDAWLYPVATLSGFFFFPVITCSTNGTGILSSPLLSLSGFNPVVGADEEWEVNFAARINFAMTSANTPISSGQPLLTSTQPICSPSVVGSLVDETPQVFSGGLKNQNYDGNITLTFFTSPSLASNVWDWSVGSVLTTPADPQPTYPAQSTTIVSAAYNALTGLVVFTISSPLVGTYPTGGAIFVDWTLTQSTLFFMALGSEITAISPDQQTITFNTNLQNTIPLPTGAFLTNQYGYVINSSLPPPANIPPRFSITVPLGSMSGTLAATASTTVLQNQNVAYTPPANTSVSSNTTTSLALNNAITFTQPNYIVNTCSPPQVVQLGFINPATPQPPPYVPPSATAGLPYIAKNQDGNFSIYVPSLYLPAFFPTTPCSFLMNSPCFTLFNGFNAQCNGFIPARVPVDNTNGKNYKIMFDNIYNVITQNRPLLNETIISPFSITTSAATPIGQAYFITTSVPFLGTVDGYTLTDPAGSYPEGTIITGISFSGGVPYIQTSNPPTAIIPSGTVLTATYTAQETLYYTTTEYSPIPVWSPVSSIVFQSAGIPVNPTNVAPTLVLGDRAAININQSTINLSNIITDFQINFDTGLEGKSIVYYAAQGEYRLFDLNSNRPLSDISIIVSWKDNISGGLHPMYLNTGEGATIKLLFRKKSYFVGGDNYQINETDTASQYAHTLAGGGRNTLNPVQRRGRY